MSNLQRAILAEKAMFVERHLSRVAEVLPPPETPLLPSSNVSDAVILHLWQATQIVLDTASMACVRLGLGTPASYADAFEKLTKAGILAPDLAANLIRASGFRNTIAHAYESLDLKRVADAARKGPNDLRAFFVALNNVAS